MSRGLSSLTAAAAASSDTPFKEFLQCDLRSNDLFGSTPAAFIAISPSLFSGNSSERYESALNKIFNSPNTLANSPTSAMTPVSPVRNFFPNINHDADFYGRVFESFFYAKGEIVEFHPARMAIINFMAHRKAAAKCSSAPTILFTAIKIQDIEFCLVAISGVIFKQNTPENKLDDAQRNVQALWQTMYDFFTFISKKTGLQYVLVGDYDPNYYQLIQAISEAMLKIKLKPTDVAKQCAERASHYLLLLLTNRFGNSLEILGSQAFQLDPKKSLTERDPCNVCLQHVEPVRAMLQTTQALSRNRSNGAAAAAAATSEERSLSPLSLGGLDGQPWPQSFQTLIHAPLSSQESNRSTDRKTEAFRGGATRAAEFHTPEDIMCDDDDQYFLKDVVFDDVTKTLFSPASTIIKPSPKKPTPQTSPEKEKVEAENDAVMVAPVPRPAFG